MNRKQKLELTWIGKDVRPRLEPRILLEDPEKPQHAKYRVKAGKALTAENAKSTENSGSLRSLRSLRLNDPGGANDWLARDLQHLLGYSKWGKFFNVFSKAKTACEVSGHPVSDHFVDVEKRVDIGSGTQNPVGLWFLAKNKPDGKSRNRRKQTLFIDARKLGVIIDSVHRKLTEPDLTLDIAIAKN